jgi:CheY-like chemotaxis protein
MSNRTAPHELHVTTLNETTHDAHILVVDDDDILRGILESILIDAGYRTDSADDGMEALTMLATGHFDLVLTDGNMPRLDGFGLIRALRASGSRIPVMMVSASLAGDAELPADVRDEVAVALPKPAMPRELLAGIASALCLHPTGLRRTLTTWGAG